MKRKNNGIIPNYNKNKISTSFAFIVYNKRSVSVAATLCNADHNAGDEIKNRQPEYAIKLQFIEKLQLHELINNNNQQQQQQRIKNWG